MLQVQHYLPCFHRLLPMCQRYSSSWHHSPTGSYFRKMTGPCLRPPFQGSQGLPLLGPPRDPRDHTSPLGEDLLALISAHLPQWMVVLRELNAPQSEIDWFMHMFTCGLDVFNPDTIIENLYFSNYGSTSKNARGLRDYLNLEVKNSHLLRTKVGSGPIPPKVVLLAFIPKPGQPGKFRLISDASAPKGFSTNSTSPMPTKFRSFGPSGSPCYKIPHRMPGQDSALTSSIPTRVCAQTNSRSRVPSHPLPSSYSLHPSHLSLLSISKHCCRSRRAGIGCRLMYTVRFGQQFLFLLPKLLAHLFSVSLGLQLDSPPTSPGIICPIRDLALPYRLLLLHHPLLYLLPPLSIYWGWSRDLDGSSKFPSLGTLPQRNLP
jgi:hypothetical protein